MGQESFDAIVIGAGQGGDPLARSFSRAGKRTAIVERAAVGGTCVNYGCTPTKTLVHIAKIAQSVRRAGEYGVRTSPPKLDMVKARELKRRIVAEFRDGTEKSLQRIEGLDLIYGQARLAGPNEVLVGLRDGGSRRLGAPLIFINTGTRPFIPDVEGIDHVPYLDNASIMELDDVPDSLIVLGGGYIGLEFGQMFARFGSRVSVIEQSPRFLPREDGDVADEVLKILTEDGLNVRTGTAAKKVSATGDGISLDIERNGMAETIRGDALLVAVGRRPNTDDLGLDLAGVETDGHGFIKTDSRLRTTAPGIYAIGDVKGGPAFTHISYDDHRVLEANLLRGQDVSTDGRQVPYCMFTDPQLGRIGLTEDEATKQGIDYKICTLPMSHVARALETNESRGFVKALVDKRDDRIIGATVLGVEGGEIMSMIQLAMLGGLSASDIHHGIFAHPTLAELLNNLFAP